MNDPLPGQPLQVVGSSWSTERGNAAAVVWSVDANGAVTGPTHLSLPNGYTVAHASDVNAHGWIVDSVRENYQSPPLQRSGDRAHSALATKSSF